MVGFEEGDPEHPYIIGAVWNGADVSPGPTPKRIVTKSGNAIVMDDAGMIEIQRDNRKAAFGAYDVAAERIRGGKSVVVFPEGTRGNAYPLRPFKKGPFVLAIAAGVPIVPIILHGTIEIMPKGSLWVHSGTVDVHLLEPVSTSGVDYDHRETLMKTVRARMADAMRDLYGVEALPEMATRLPSSVEMVSSETQPTETR